MGSVDAMSPTKRERLKRQAKLRRRKDMRAALPILTREEIRRFRVPYYEAVLLELDEEGFTSTAEFLRQLLQYQEDLRREHGPDSAVSARPQLLTSKEQLDILYLGLKNAEKAHYIDDIGTECDHLIKLGVTFGLGSQDWWWLGEQLLIQAVSVSSAFQKDGKRREATSRYINGKFVLENILEAHQAKEELTLARQLSTGQHWSAAREMGYKQDTIFVESCKLLYKALLDEAQEVMSYDPLKAARICAIARKRATDACDHNGEAEVLMLQGSCEMNGGEPSAAVVSFTKALLIQTKAAKTEGICEARIQLALAYLKTGKSVEALNQLEKLLAFAEVNNLLHYTAQAYRYLGEYHLNQGTPHLATPLLIKALNIFDELEAFRDINREQAGNLAAISAGQELIPKYIELILKCGREGLKKNVYVMKLVQWKDTRELFWAEGDESSIASRSTASFERSSMNLSGYEIPLSIGDEAEGEYDEGFYAEMELIHGQIIEPALENQDNMDCVDDAETGLD